MNQWTLDDYLDRDRLFEHLKTAGLSESAAAHKSERFVQVAQTLVGHGLEASDAIGFFVPGRIEVLGKHTDYAGGRSLIAAAERGFCGVAVAREDSLVRIIDVASGQQAEFPFSAASTSTVPQGDWSNYPWTVVRRLAGNFPGPLKGATIAFSSDLPPAAGMSSSSALMVMTFLLLARINNLTEYREYQDNIDSLESLAGYLGTVENGQNFGTLIGDRGVGTFGGSEDHTAMLCSQPGQLAQFSYCPVRHERLVSVPENLVFVIAVSGIVAEKTGAAMEQYNRASRRAQAVTEMWRQATGRDDPHLAAAINSSDGAVDQLRRLLRQNPHDEFDALDLVNRLEQFFAESEEIIPAVPDRLETDQLDRFGQLVLRSQTLGARQLGNQIPQTEFLATQAYDRGAIAASAFGAGFGGSVWALVQKHEAESFAATWREQYANTFPAASEVATFFETRPGPAVIPLGSSML